MKKLILIFSMFLGTTTLNAQNQFRDYVEFRKEQLKNVQRPEIVHKDGKVIITMTEEQFRRRQNMNRHMMMNNRMRAQCRCNNFGPAMRPKFGDTNFSPRNNPNIPRF